MSNKSLLIRQSLMKSGRPAAPDENFYDVLHLLIRGFTEHCEAVGARLKWSASPSGDLSHEDYSRQKLINLIGFEYERMRRIKFPMFLPRSEMAPVMKRVGLNVPEVRYPLTAPKNIFWRPTPAHGVDLGYKPEDNLMQTQPYNPLAEQWDDVCLTCQ